MKMRRWSVERVFADGSCRLLCDGWPVTDGVSMQWVADACNAAEREAHPEEVTAEEDRLLRLPRLTTKISGFS